MGDRSERDTCDDYVGLYSSNGGKCSRTELLTKPKRGADRFFQYVRPNKHRAESGDGWDDESSDARHHAGGAAGNNVATGNAGSDGW